MIEMDDGYYPIATSGEEQKSTDIALSYLPRNHRLGMNIMYTKSASISFIERC